MIERLDIHQLQTWYLEHARKLPFRETKEPYRIWVSEIMLQQTKMDTVLPYYKRFMEVFPTVHELAKTTQETLLKLLEGIGYYRRFKHMLEAAKIIVDEYNGVFPTDYKSIKGLPGIGDYTAGAIMSIAYNQPFAATDGNVIRVLSRVYNLSKDMRVDKHKKEVHQLNQTLIEKAIPRIYTEALMEVGALVCLPKKPKCDVCPIKSTCFAFVHNLQNHLPVISQKPKKKVIKYMTLVIHTGQTIWVRKRTEKLLEGMFEFPQFESENFDAVKTKLSTQGVQITLLKKDSMYEHIFTHQKWVMQVYHVRLEGQAKPEWVNIPIKEIYQYPMAKAHRQINIKGEL